MTNIRYPGSLTAAGSFDDGTIQNFGIRFFFTASQTLHGFYVYSPVLQTVTLGLYEVDNAVIARQNTSVTLAVGDNYIPFSSAFACTANKTYFAFSTMRYYAVTAVPEGTSTNHVEGTFSGGTGTVDALNGAKALSVLGAGTTAPTPPLSYSSVTSNLTNWAGVGVYYDNAGTGATLTVNAGLDQSVTTGTAVTLTATASNSTGTVTWAWSQVDGPAATVTTPTSATAHFTPSTAGTYTFRATATDTVGSAHDDIVVTVTDPPAPPAPIGNGVIWVKDPTSGDWSQLSSTATGPDSHVFRVDDYGAVGDGVTDDTAAIQACIDAAFAAAPLNNYNVEVRFSSKQYLIGGVPTVGTEYGYAQLHIPFWSATDDGPKITMTFKGANDNAPLLYWAQRQAASGGTVLKSTWSGSTSSSTAYGIPSVLGGPTLLSASTGATQDDIATFSNMLVVIDGIQVQIPHGSALGGFGLRRVAEANIVSASVFTNRSLYTSPQIKVLPTDDNSYGLLMPAEGNNARNQIGCFTSEGVSIGIITQEHTSAQYLAFVYCRTGLLLSGSSGLGTWPDGTRKETTHPTWIGMLLCEAVNYWVSNAPPTWVSATGYPGSTSDLVISQLGGEGVTNFVAHINDPSNLLTGEIHWADLYNEFPVVLGGKRLRIVADTATRGVRTSPTVPATTVALTNPFWRDAAVYVTGGTVTGIAIEGQSTGLTSGMVMVGTGQTITLTYSAAPTWTWILL